MKKAIKNKVFSDGTVDGYYVDAIDGTGYPHKIKGEEIPIQSRIIAVADAFDAMTKQCTYRKVMSVKEAAKEKVN